MPGTIAIGQLCPAQLIGHFGVPPKCRMLFMPSPDLISAKQVRFQRLKKMEGFLRIGPLSALYKLEVGLRKRSASSMSNSVNVPEVQIWP